MSSEKIKPWLDSEVTDFFYVERGMLVKCEGGEELVERLGSDHLLPIAGEGVVLSELEKEF